MWTPSTVVVVIRDLTLLGLGSWGIVYQQLSGSINVPLLVLYTALVGAPGGLGLVRLVARSALIEHQSSLPQESSPGGVSPQ